MSIVKSVVDSVASLSEGMLRVRNMSPDTHSLVPEDFKSPRGKLPDALGPTLVWVGDYSRSNFMWFVLIDSTLRGSSDSIFVRLAYEDDDTAVYVEKEFNPSDDDQYVGEAIELMTLVKKSPMEFDILDDLVRKGYRKVDVS